MIRKISVVAVAALFALTVCACSSGGGAQSSSAAGAADSSAASSESTTVDSESAAASSESQAAEYDPVVDAIDLTLEGGTIRYNRFEKANEGLTDKENALVFVFDFTNAQSTPAECQSVFRIQFFQNGAELSGSNSYSSKGGEQYELVGAFFNSAMKGGTVTFGQIVVPKDDSPITVMVSPNGAALEDNYQTMEVAINDESSGSSAASSKPSSAAPAVSADDVDALLQGAWQSVGDETGTFVFEQGSVDVSAPGGTLSGTYEVDVDASLINGFLETTDGTVKIHLPFEYDGETLKVYNNNGGEMTRM